MTTKYRVNNRIRFTLFVVIVIILITSIANFALGLNTASSLTNPEYMEVEVAYGDTLWSIADNYMSDDTDIRKSVYEICDTNNISASDLYAGMTILVPIN